jgi:hypothetical protein
MDSAPDVNKINFYIDKTSNSEDFLQTINTSNSEDFLQTLERNQIENGSRSMYLTHN